MGKEHVLVTGATGFVGAALVQRLLENKPVAEIVASVRGYKNTLPAGVKQAVMGDLLEELDWQSALENVSAVVHCAARVHMISDKATDPLAAFRAVNVRGTLNLARQAATRGVRRFVFISSIGVNGAETFQRPFTTHDEVAPHSPYAVSKYEAELALQTLSVETGMEVVIIRPPLIYGPNAPGNFGSLMRWLRRGVPLPLGAIHNQRSLVALDNLVDLMVTCLKHPAAAGQTFLVSDGEDVSTTELLRRMGRALDCDPRLIPVPASLLKLAAAMVGKRDVAQRLCASLQVDIDKTRRLLGWCPPFTLDQGLTRAAEGSGT